MRAPDWMHRCAREAVPSHQRLELDESVPDLIVRAKAACALAETVVRRGDIARARQLARNGLDGLPDAPQYALARVFCYLRAAAVERWAGDGNAAVDDVESAQEIAARSGPSSALGDLRIAIDLAESYRIASRPGEASRAFEVAHARLVALGRENTERSGTLLNNWGLVLISLGRPREAERMLRRAVEISSADGRERRVEPVLWNNIARSLFDQGRYPEAIALSERAHAGARREGDALVAGQALILRERIHISVGDVSQAVPLLADVEAQFTRTLPAAHVALAVVAIERARLAAARHDLTSALGLAGRAIAVVEASHGGAEMLPRFLVERSAIALAMGRVDAARADAARALELETKRTEPGSLSIHIGRTQLALGRALAAANQPDDARRVATAALGHLEPLLGTSHPDTRDARRLLRIPDSR